MITKLLNEVNENIKTLNNLVQDKEYFEKLDERIEKVNNYVQEQKQEIERLNKRINELEDRLERIRNNEREKVGIKAARLGIPSHSLEKLQKLKGEDKK